MGSMATTIDRYFRYTEESRDWHFKADYPEMTIRVKSMEKEAPAYFIDYVTGEETDCRVLDYIVETPPFFRSKEAFETFKRRCDEVASRGIASCSMEVDGSIYYVAVG